MYTVYIFNKDIWIQVGKVNLRSLQDCLDVSAEVFTLGAPLSGRFDPPGDDKSDTGKSAAGEISCGFQPGVIRNALHLPRA